MPQYYCKTCGHTNSHDDYRIGCTGRGYGDSTCCCRNYVRAEMPTAEERELVIVKAELAATKAVLQDLLDERGHNHIEEIACFIEKVVVPDAPLANRIRKLEWKKERKISDHE